MRAGVKVLIPLLGVFAGLIVPASGQAAVTFGSDLTATPTAGFGCGPCTLSNRDVAPERRAAGGFVAPADGVVVRWRVKIAAVTAPLSLQILRPGSSDTRASTGSSSEQTPDLNSISTYDTRLPVKAGDVLGIHKQSNVSAEYLFIEGSAPVVLRWDGPNVLVDGGAAKTGSGSGPYEVLINADIEPDADGDGFGDESQDLCPEDATFQVACRQLQVVIDGDGVVRAPGIDCPGDCTERYALGQAVALLAYSGEGSKFAGFSGGCVGGSPCSFTGGSNATATATFAEDDPPETTITKKPKKSGTKKNVTIGFSSDEANSTFECKLDSGDYKPCLSPYRLRVNPGRHTFTIRAIDAAGNVDETPAFTNFRVKKPKKR